MKRELADFVNEFISNEDERACFFEEFYDNLFDTKCFPLVENIQFLSIDVTSEFGSGWKTIIEYVVRDASACFSEFGFKSIYLLRFDDDEEEKVILFDEVKEVVSFIEEKFETVKKELSEEASLWIALSDSITQKEVEKLKNSEFSVLLEKGANII